MIFLEVASKTNKKVNFEGFITVLARISLKIYPDHEDPLETILHLIEEFLFSKSLN
jgi:hypothetical protein